MSIASEIAALANDVIAIRTAISNKGGTVGASDGFDDFAADIATIPTGGGSVTVDPLSVTENGTYTAPSDHAYSPVTVNVPQGEIPVYTEAEMDALLVAENIGKVYLYCGSSGTYTPGDIYVVAEA